MAETDISIVVGNSRIITVPVTYEDDDSVVDLTGYSAKLYVKAKSSDASPLIEVAGTITTPTNGIITFGITHANTTAKTPANYKYIVTVYKTDLSDVQTVIEGVFVLKECLHEVV
jgi:hypothetical protein